MSASRADRVAAQLRTLIEDEFTDGDHLPSEAKLSRSLGVSRSTLREVFSRLWQDGLIEKKWGVGTIVRKPRARQSGDVTVLLPLPYLRSGSALIRQSGYEPSATDVSVTCVTADPNMAQLLDIAEGDEFWMVDRIVCADGLPVQRTIDAMPVEVDGDSFDASEFDALNNTLHMLCEAQLKSRVFRSDGRLSATRGPGDTAARLQMHESETALLVEHTTYLESGSIISYTANWYHPSRVDIRFASERQHISPPKQAASPRRLQSISPTSISSYLERLD